MKVKIRIQDHGVIGGFTGQISLDGGETWIKLRKYVGGGLVNFDSKEQIIKEAKRIAKREMRAA